MPRLDRSRPLRRPGAPRPRTGRPRSRGFGLASIVGVAALGVTLVAVPAGCATGQRRIPPTITVAGVLVGPADAVFAPGSAVRIRLVGPGGVLDEVAPTAAEGFPVPFDVRYDRESVGGVGRIEAIVIGTRGGIDWSLAEPVTLPLDGRTRAVEGRMQAPRSGIGP